jgi:hypothetical protein
MRVPAKARRVRVQRWGLIDTRVKSVKRLPSCEPGAMSKRRLQSIVRGPCGRALRKSVQ